MPRDANQRAKLIVDLVLGEADEQEPSGKDPERVARGKLGGAKGGTIRAAKLTPEHRQEIARKAAAARWGKGEDLSESR